ncbi:MAG: hypothetical protein ACI8W3_002628 [Myxococcota bacterium]|jgi:hypothetical protein
MPKKQCVSAEIEIDSTPERVFEILTDLSSYPAWNPFTPKIESSLKVGAPVRMRVRLFPSLGLQSQVEYVTENTPAERLCWGADIPWRFLLRADRCQTLVALPGGRTRYVCTDHISGWLTPFVMRFFGEAMRKGFEDCALALKQRAEA